MYRRLAIAALLTATFGCEPASEPEYRQLTFALDMSTDGPVNTPPVATDDVIDVDEDDSATFDVLANDVDDDGDALTVFVSDSTNEGVLEDLGSGQFRYTPRPNFVGADSFTYGVLDGNGGSAEATVAISVTNVNDAPQFVAPTPPAGALIDATVAEPLDIALITADVDGDAVTLSFDLSDATTTPVIDGQTLRWVPAPADLGPHLLTVTASDGSETDMRDLTVTVRAAADAPCGASICTGGTVCFDGSCLPPCLSHDDCASPDLCFDGRCASDACEHRDCDAPESCALGGCFRECAFDGECRPGQRCWGTRCAETSCEDVVCAVGETCVGGVCRSECEQDGDCATGGCFAGGCAIEACDGVLCPAGQQCAEGDCVPEGDVPADEPQFENAGCGCAGTDAGVIGWPALLVLLGLAAARRR